MSSETGDATSTLVYDLTCTDCGYETTVEGSAHDALDVAEAHQEEYGDAYTDHVVDLELTDRTV